jgi:hypothetical protein
MVRKYLAVHPTFRTIAKITVRRGTHDKFVRFYIVTDEAVRFGTLETVQ